MNTSLRSFIDIFEETAADGKQTVKVQKIIIPMIQRDYAQGRPSAAVSRIRSRFLDSLYNAIVNQSITLDFIYGDIDEHGVMTPLDGQQRLTSLFLLHWYAAKKEGIPAEEYAFLKNFSYETRYCSRDFCEQLITAFHPSFKGKLSDEIIDQDWFPLDWQKDSTISSMLVMLDAINNKFQKIENLWTKLKEGAIKFYFLPIKDMGLTDELYIKINSRGKPLTSFENFKAELEQYIKEADESVATRVIHKIDTVWTNLLWQYRNSVSRNPEDMLPDDKFLNFFRFICDIICYKNGESPQEKSMEEMLADFFSTEKTDKAKQNIALFESYFDCWCNIDGYGTPTEFLDSFISHSSEEGKIVVDKKNEIDIFKDCLYSYADKSGRNRQFPLNRIVLLYAVTVFLCNRERVSNADFIKRIRCINNLIQNSADEISDRTNHNRMPAIIKQTDAILLDGRIDETIEKSFNANQITEEQAKKAFLEEHPQSTQLVHTLEDHPNLKGQVGIIGLANIQYANRFVSLFSCDRDLIDCALMSMGDYGQRERNKKRYQYASKGMQLAWDALFHKSANDGFENTSNILIKLLESAESFTNDRLKEIINDFIGSCEKSRSYPWRYYYVKYAAFRPGSYGKYHNEDAKHNPYMFLVMRTKSYISSTSYMPYLKEADASHLSTDDNGGQRLSYGKYDLVCTNNAYILRDNETKQEIARLDISQNEKGIDTEDRILLLKDYIQKHSCAWK